jgi:hypothetical protein
MIHSPLVVAAMILGATAVIAQSRERPNRRRHGRDQIMPQRRAYPSPGDGRRAPSVRFNSPGDLAAYRDAAWLLKRHSVSVLPSVASLKGVLY